MTRAVRLVTAGAGQAGVPIGLILAAGVTGVLSLVTLFALWGDVFASMSPAATSDVLVWLAVVTMLGAVVTFAALHAAWRVETRPGIGTPGSGAALPVAGDASGPDLRRLRAAQRVTAGLSNDMNGILTRIQGNLQVLQEVADPTERRKVLHETLEATRRGCDLSRTMMQFARHGRARVGPIDLNEVALGLRPLLRRMLPERIALRLRMADGLPGVLGDRSMAESAILNLALNARDAMPGGGQLTITTCVVPCACTGFGVHDPCVCLTVEDNGCGIEPEIRDRLFEPFVATRGASGHSGLGLAMVRCFARQSGGRVEVTSAAGEGSRFRIFCPAAGSAAGDAALRRA